MRGYSGKSWYTIRTWCVALGLGLLANGATALAMDGRSDSVVVPNANHGPRVLVAGICCGTLRTGAAPTVSITGLVDGAAQTDTLTVEAEVLDEGGGIGRIEWNLNGIAIGSNSRDFDLVASGSDANVPLRTSQSVSLLPGENRIEVVAYDAAGEVHSAPAAITVKMNASAQAKLPKLYVLSVGVNEYGGGIPALNYATSDAISIGSAFKRAGDGLYESVEVTTLLDAEVTAGRLDQVFAELGEQVGPADVFVLFMAGQGTTRDGRYYFLPQDFHYVDESSIETGGIGQGHLQDWVSRIRALKSVLIFDTCGSHGVRSGTPTRGPSPLAIRPPATSESSSFGGFSELARATGRTVLGASTGSAFEGYEGHGVFTHALLRALGDGDANANGTVEISELAGLLARLVPELSDEKFGREQVPEISLVGEDFPLTRSQPTMVMEDVPPSGTEGSVPTALTHVVIADVSAHALPDDRAMALKVLVPGTLVTRVSSEGGYALVARQGDIIGYVPDVALAEMR